MNPTRATRGCYVTRSGIITFFYYYHFVDAYYFELMVRRFLLLSISIISSYCYYYYISLSCRVGFFLGKKSAEPPTNMCHLFNFRRYKKLYYVCLKNVKCHMASSQSQTIYAGCKNKNSFFLFFCLLKQSKIGAFGCRVIQVTVSRFPSLSFFLFSSMCVYCPPASH